LNNELKQLLALPEAFPFPVKKIQVKETHISWVFLGENTVFKVKKPVKFSFLDFSTLEKRKFYCEEEVRLNSRLCAEVYIGVVPITRTPNGLQFEGKGDAVEYAVKMKRLPEEKKMSLLLEQGKVGKKSVKELAVILAEFHSRIKKISDTRFSSPRQLKEQFNDILTVRKAIERELGAGKVVDFIIEKSNSFIDENAVLLKERQRNGFIRECHGDLHSGNIFLLEKPVIFDCIEFSEDFRNTDTASDVGFMAMDFDSFGEQGLSKEFTKSYVEHSADFVLERLLPWHKLYRANVRAKVNALRLLQDANEAAKKETNKYLQLAKGYAEML